ncbi:MAG: MarC family protein [Bacteroidetes bacterium]|jgi:multiple antibiotic resistance protein|nr:MarC family protein [Bacteroidota bacterium]
MSFDPNALLLSFIPLFVAIDVLGVVPIFLSLTDRLDRSQKRRLVTDATLAALGVSLAFLFFGRFLFNVMGITEDDFRVGGGIVLLVLAIVDLLFSHDQQRSPETSTGIVPIGVPLIIGPAALTTILILVDTYGVMVTVLSLLANLAIVWLVFRYSEVVVRVVGRGGSKAIAKVASLFMVAIAVMMIRVGLTNMMR